MPETEPSVVRLLSHCCLTVVHPSVGVEFCLHKFVKPKFVSSVWKPQPFQAPAADQWLLFDVPVAPCHRGGTCGRVRVHEQLMGR